MSLDHFGTSFDIHGGGHDLRFPHHEAEIFQSECHTGHAPLAGYWLHNGFVNIDGEKMSKSLGNFWTIQDIIQKVDPLVLRLALVNAHYRSPIDMNEQLLNDAQRNHDRILKVYESALRMATDGRQHQLPTPDITSTDPLTKSLGLLERLGEGFAQAMDDDFNSREAVAKVLAQPNNCNTCCPSERMKAISEPLQRMQKIGLKKLQEQFLESFRLLMSY